jgi:putative ATPase
LYIYTNTLTQYSQSAEEDIYTHQSDLMLNWDVGDLRNALAMAGLLVQVKIERSVTQMHITSAFVNRLFVNNPVRPSYADRLGKNLKEEEVRAVEELFNRYLLNQTVAWETTIAFVLGSDISQHAD